jgi:hypothetical protein
LRGAVSRVEAASSEPSEPDRFAGEARPRDLARAQDVRPPVEVVPERSEGALGNPGFDRPQELCELECAAERDADLPAVLLLLGSRDAVGTESIAQALRNVTRRELDEKLVGVECGASPVECLACHDTSVAETQVLPSEPTASTGMTLSRADGETRTPDPFITSEVLYQLSYVGMPEEARLV